MLRLFSLAMVLLSCHPAFAQDKPASEPQKPRPAEARVGPNAAKPQPSKKIVYRRIGDKELLLHVFQSAGHKPENACPAIVFFHGRRRAREEPQSSSMRARRACS